MENKEKNEIIPEEFEENEEYENTDAEIKPMWQLAKEQQYAKLNITVKQLDMIIGFAVAALVLVFILIGLDAAGIF